ncbi:MAG: exodeoxyribonuclease VII small subunit [Ruminococcus sp.]|jgi:exodeoxyribonuclease VII small subunit|nr:exodeoxyribonuclease VII small subunit [Ruminococcus sp.]
MAEEKQNIPEEKHVPLEEMFGKLEEVIGKLEGEDVNLEESFRLYKEGMTLLKKCNAAIDTVEKKVLVLDEDGSTHEL